MFRIFIFSTLLLCKLHNVTAATDIAEIEQYLHNAQTYYWLSLQEKCDMRALRNGLTSLDSLDLALGTLPKDNPELIKKRSISKSLRENILAQIDLAQDTFYGVFPMVRLFCSTLFYDPSANESYELYDDPDVIAVTTGLKRMIDGPFQSWRINPQLPVIVTSTPRNINLEQELVYLLNASPLFYPLILDLYINDVNDKYKMLLLKGEYSSEILEYFDEQLHSKKLCH